MNPLLARAAFARGVRQELLRQGISEADASSLTKLAMYQYSFERSSEDFLSGFNKVAESYGFPVIKRKKEFDFRKWLPWILGTAGLATIMFTPWGNRRLHDLFGGPGTGEKHRKTLLTPLVLDNEEQKTSGE